VPELTNMRLAQQIIEFVLTPKLGIIYNRKNNARSVSIIYVYGLIIHSMLE